MRTGTKYDRFTPDRINDEMDKPTIDWNSNNRTCFKCKVKKSALGGTFKYLRSGGRAFICRDCLQ